MTWIWTDGPPNDCAVKALKHLRLAEGGDPAINPLMETQMAVAYALLAHLDISLGESQPESGGPSPPSAKPPKPEPYPNIFFVEGNALGGSEPTP